MKDEPPDRDPRAPDDRTGRRAVWGRRIAIAVLVTFAAFLIFNAAIVLVLLLRSAAGGGGPFGN